MSGWVIDPEEALVQSTYLSHIVNEPLTPRQYLWVRCHLLTHWRADRCVVCAVAAESLWPDYLWAALGFFLALAWLVH